MRKRRGVGYGMYSALNEQPWRGIRIRDGYGQRGELLQLSGWIKGVGEGRQWIARKCERRVTFSALAAREYFVEAPAENDLKVTAA